MIDPNAIIATPWSESSGLCDCCGQTSKRIWGDLAANGATLAVYFVHWTFGRPEHYPNIDLIVGAWGEGSDQRNRFLASLLYRPSLHAGSFMVIDADERAKHYVNLFGRAMRRAEIVGTPLGSEIFDLVDAIWLTEPRIEGISDLDRAAT